MEYKQDELIEALGYKKLSEQTWKEHGEKCESHPIDGCGKLSPDCNEFFDRIVFQKKINGNVFEIARRKDIDMKKWGSTISIYRFGFVYIGRTHKIIRRTFWEFLDGKNLATFIEHCELECHKIIKSDSAC